MIRLKFREALKFAALFSVISMSLFAQRVPANYTSLAFRKVAPDKVDAFLAFTKSQTKKLAQTRVNSGGITGWSLLKLTTPYSAGSDFNYVIANYSSSYPDLDPSRSEVDAVYQKAGLNRGEYAKQQRELSTLISQQIARTVLRVGTAAEVGDFVRVDYHSTPADRPGELMELEERIYAPMFKTITASGKGPHSWTVAAPVLPLASELGYNFYTTQIYKDSASLGAGLGLGQEIFSKTHPNLNYLNHTLRVRELDKIVKVRIYHVLDMVGGPVLPK